MTISLPVHRLAAIGKLRLGIAAIVVAALALFAQDMFRISEALDNRSQAIVTEALGKLTSTRIVVAHRLSTIRDVDRIVVLDRGRVVENGTCEQFLAAKGHFAALAARQLA